MPGLLVEPALTLSPPPGLRPEYGGSAKGITAMPIMVRDNRAFTPTPEGLHQAVCVDVVDLGLVDGPWGAKPTVELRWELDLANEETGRPFLVSKRYTLSLNEKATLRQHLQAWRGRAFTPPELEGFVNGRPRRATQGRPYGARVAT